MAIAALLLVLAAPADTKLCRDDVRFALQALEKECGHLIKEKGISWGKVRRQFTAEAKQVTSREEHWVLLWRLVVRLRDGHADVRTTEATKDLKWPLHDLEAGPGVSWCVTPDGLCLKEVWGDAQGAGLTPGLEVLKVDDEPAGKWLDGRVAELSDMHSWSTPQGGVYFACHWGLGGPKGSRMQLELRDPVSGDTRSVTLGRTSGGLAPSGPVFYPKELEHIGRNSFGRLPSGHGYIHLRNVPESLPADLDAMLAKLDDPAGLVLDCRANGGGGCEHDEVFGKFVPKGQTLRFGGHRSYACTSDRPYAGPVVVIVDAGVRSAGETVSGMLKEDGRAYMIGPEPTAGMSSQKKTIDLPSGLFTLYVSVRSNKADFNKGKGIEGVGVAPHEIVPYDPKDLAGGVDTQIRRAVELLQEGFPRNAIPYKPERFGWKGP